MSTNLDATILMLTHISIYYFEVKLTIISLTRMIKAIETTP